MAIAAPRGHAKSTAITHAYVLANVLFRIRDFVVIVSDTEGQSKEFLGDIKKELTSNEQLQTLFKIKSFPKDTETDIVVEFEDGEQFRILAKGSEQKVRGLKWNNKRPNLIVCDDMENDEIVMNKDRREKFRKWFMGALIPCLAPDGLIRVVGTILHLDSLLARICPQEGYKNTVIEPLKTWDKNPRTAWKAVVYRAHVGSAPKDIQSDKDVLWPERFNKQWFVSNYTDKVELGHPELYAQELLNRPLDEATSYFRKSDFLPITIAEKEEIENGKKPLLYYAGVDLAISESERADYSVFHVVGVDAGNIIYHVDTIKARMDGREIVNTLLGLKLKYKDKLQFVAIEAEKIQKSIGSFLREEMLKRNLHFEMIEITPSKDKMTRAKPLQGRMRIGGVKFDKEAEYYPALEGEFLQFPRARHDDQVDAYAYIGLALDKLASALTYQEEQEEEIDHFERSHNNVIGFNSGRCRTTGY